MSSFVPRGYKRLTDVCKELGHEELRQQLASGERTAFYWDQRSLDKPLREIPINQWLGVHADKLIKQGGATWAPRPFVPEWAKWERRELIILIADVKPNATPLRANKGGRPQAPYWSDIEQLVGLEVKRRGFPRLGLKGWANQSDVERWVADQLQDKGKEAGESSIRDHVREMLNKLRTQT